MGNITFVKTVGRGKGLEPILIMVKDGAVQIRQANGNRLVRAKADSIHIEPVQLGEVLAALTQAQTHLSARHGAQGEPATGSPLPFETPDRQSPFEVGTIDIKITLNPDGTADVLSVVDGPDRVREEIKNHHRDKYEAIVKTAAAMLSVVKITSCNITISEDGA